MALVVLPMPISPPINTSAWRSAARCAARSPAASAACNWASVMAGWRARFPVPGAMCSSITPSSMGSGLTVPRLITSRAAPSCFAMTLMAAPPATKLAIICPVTAWGKAEMPSSQTPWSAAKTAMQTCSMRGRFVACRPARVTARDSSSPSEPAGLVSWAWRCRAACRWGSLGAAIGCCQGKGVLTSVSGWGGAGPESGKSSAPQPGVSSTLPAIDTGQ